MHGFTDSQQYGNCDLCRKDGLLGFFDCPYRHWCCVSCFFRWKKRSEKVVFKCPFSCCIVTAFCYYIKVEDDQSIPTVVIRINEK
jgi:hypothetical protein